jgi:creatinine amidohydrolase/Fe(II)-dependent formamide hydrolase-like protein
LIEKFSQKYQISEEVAQAIISEFTPQHDAHGATEEYSLMYQAFLDNDSQIDSEEMAQLLELQEELGLTQEQVDRIELEIQAEV